MNRFVLGGVFLVVLVIGRVPDAAATVLVNGSGSGLSASASFTISGTTLTILLTNTDPAPRREAWTRSEVLTGLFFNLGTAADVFTPVSATIAGGALAQGAQCTEGPCNDSTTNVGGEWGYAFGGVADRDIAGANRGIATASYLNGNANFNGPNLDNSAALNGVDFGILPSTFEDGAGNAPVDKDPFIRGSSTFVLNIPKGLTEAMISNVYFQYGTNTNKASFSTSTTSTGSTTTTNGMGTVPEPSLFALAAVGFALASYRLRRTRV
jgi:hypothetical protein